MARARLKDDTEAELFYEDMTLAEALGIQVDAGAHKDITLKDYVEKYPKRFEIEFGKMNPGGRVYAGWVLVYEHYENYIRGHTGVPKTIAATEEAAQTRNVLAVKPIIRKELKKEPPTLPRKRLL